MPPRPSSLRRTYFPRMFFGFFCAATISAGTSDGSSPGGRRDPEHFLQRYFFFGLKSTTEYCERQETQWSGVLPFWVSRARSIDAKVT
jgi:hypothetical protein